MANLAITPSGVSLSQGDTVSVTSTYYNNYVLGGYGEDDYTDKKELLTTANQPLLFTAEQLSEIQTRLNNPSAYDQDSWSEFWNNFYSVWWTDLIDWSDESYTYSSNYDDYNTGDSQINVVVSGKVSESVTDGTYYLIWLNWDEYRDESTEYLWTNVNLKGIETLEITIGAPSPEVPTSTEFPTERPDDYDPDLVWDKNEQAWVALGQIPLSSLGGGRYNQQLVAVSDQGKIYFGGV